jgi:acyl-CoA synthetase (AMP-forming)/AMP-acid ligase II
MILVPQAKIDDYTARGWWGSVTLWDLLVKNLREHPDAEAVVDAPNRADFAHGRPRRLTWAQLAAEVDVFSLQLMAKGIARDDVLIMQLPNCVEQFVVYLSCARLGIIVSPVPVQYREHELGHVLHATKATAAVTFARIGKEDNAHQSAAMFAGLQTEHAALKTVLLWEEFVTTVLSKDDLQVLKFAELNTKVTANDVFTICWTSGTEAQPKGVPRSHNEWLIVAPSIIEAADIKPHARLLNPFVAGAGRHGGAAPAF